MQRLAFLAVFALLAGCTKADPPGGQGTGTAASGAPSSAPVAVGTASAPAAPASAPVAVGAAAAPAAGGAVAAGSFAGTYDAKASTLYLPDTKEMQRVKWRGDETTDALGAGKLTLTVAADGTVQGESTGPLGALVIVGQAQGDTLGATLQPKTPTEGGYTGTLHAKKSATGYAGEIHLTRHDASVLRTATFELTAK